MYSLFTRFPFLRIVLYWIMGLLMAEKFHSHLAICLGLLLFFLLLLFLSFRKSPLYPSFVFFLIFFSCSFFYNSLRFIDLNQKPPLSEALVFDVLDEPVEKAKTWSFTGRILAYKTQNKWHLANFKVKFYLSKDLLKPQIGDQLITISNLQKFSLPVFPNEQNWAMYYQRKGILGSMFVKSHEVLLIKKAESCFRFDSFFFDLQERLSNHLAIIMKSERNRVVASAMLLGTRSHIDFETMQTYASLGAIHILSVSGMHVGLLYIGLSFIFGFLLKKGRLGAWVFFLIMMILLWLYAGISGFSAPVLRSAWMFSLMLFAKSFGFQRNTINLLAFSCFVLLVYDPNQLFQSGFQLSYLAVLGLLIYQSRISNLVKINFNPPIIRFFAQQIWDLSTVAVAAQIFTLPLVIYYFHQLPHPFYFFLLNPLLILLSSVSLGLGLLFVSFADVLVYVHLDQVYFGLGYVLDKSFDLLHALMFYVVNGVHPVISFLQMELWEIYALLMILICLEFWYHYRRSFFLYLNAFIVLLLVLYHNLWIPYHVDKQQFLYFSHYKKDLVFIQIHRDRATILGSKGLFQDGAWIQSHISPLCAYHHIRDTICVVLPAKVNLSWKMQQKVFFYMQNTSEKVDKQLVDVLFFGSEIKWKNPYWMKSWKGDTWYFVQGPSPFYRKKWELEFRRYANSVASLDTLRF